MSLKRSSTTSFPDEDPEFQVAPMIDILLVLMTFFMSITSTEVLKTTSKLSMELAIAPSSKKPEGKPREVVLNVAWNSAKQMGDIEFEEKLLSGPEEATNVIIRRKGNSHEFFQAVIRADGQVPYSFVQQVLAACAGADVDKITFAVVDKAKNPKVSGGEK